MGGSSSRQDLYIVPHRPDRVPKRTGAAIETLECDAENDTNIPGKGESLYGFTPIIAQKL